MNIVEAVEHKSDGSGSDVILSSSEIGISVSVLSLAAATVVVEVEAVNGGHPLGRTDGRQNGSFQFSPRVELSQLLNRFVLK